MAYRSRLLASITVLGLTALVSHQAQATGLFGAGNSVQASFDFFNTVTQQTVGEPEVNPAISLSLDTANPSNPPCTADTPACVIYGPGDLLTISEGAEDLSTLQLSDNQISIFNVFPGATSPPLSPTPPFCSTDTTNCPSEVWAFIFNFAGNIDITALTMDSASAADFQPIALELLSPTEVEVDVAGDNPKDGDPLIVDLAFASTTPPTDVPEPASLAIFGAGLAALGFVRRKRKTS